MIEEGDFWVFMFCLQWTRMDSSLGKGMEEPEV